MTVTAKQYFQSFIFGALLPVIPLLLVTTSTWFVGYVGVLVAVAIGSFFVKARTV